MNKMFFYDIYTVYWRDWVVFTRTYKKFLLSRMVTPLLYILAFGIGLGRNISVDGGSYLSFIIPGMIAMNSMNMVTKNEKRPLFSARAIVLSSFCAISYFLRYKGFIEIL